MVQYINRLSIIKRYRYFSTLPNRYIAKVHKGTCLLRALIDVMLILLI
uniref:Uncharacterized protein n=3 Tax=Vibrionaceae TaxID=641 RepID=A0A0H4A359_VIBSP|nr:hypothetical protein [Enterovibrio norvegicus]AKN40157.1 hypothetical protein [Vibrio sp. FF_482]AKN40669.1 hypothetical protein [Vibrio splendidus]